MVRDTFLDLRGVAEYTGLEYATVRWYHNMATGRRREGNAKTEDMPEPDAVHGRSPVWRTATIDAWTAVRPGRGTGGGRPATQPTEETATDNMGAFAEQLRNEGIAVEGFEREPGKDQVGSGRYGFTLRAGGQVFTVQMPGGPFTLVSRRERLRLNGLPMTWKIAMKMIADATQEPQ